MKSRGFESALFLISALLLGRWASNAWEAHVFQASALRALDHGTSIARGEIVGRLVVPSIGVDAAVAEGVDTRTLRHAVGHIPGTALPGGGGNVALAGHRDTFLAKLGRVRLGDEIRIETPEHVYRYAVESRRVVGPTAMEVIAPAPRSILTLVTCYPFHVLGPAPERFVVQARLKQVDQAPATAVSVMETAGRR